MPDLIELDTDLGGAPQTQSRRWLAHLPGFRSGKWWKAALAVPAYLWIGIGALMSLEHDPLRAGLILKHHWPRRSKAEKLESAQNWVSRS